MEENFQKLINDSDEGSHAIHKSELKRPLLHPSQTRLLLALIRAELDIHYLYSNLLELLEAMARHLIRSASFLRREQEVFPGFLLVKFS